MNEIYDYIDNPAELFNDWKIEFICDGIAKEILGFDPDATTAEGRRDIKYMAYKIERTKLEINIATKNLIEDQLIEMALTHEDVEEIELRAIYANKRLSLMIDKIMRPLTELDKYEENEDE